jgi:hypothetical protein
LDTLPEVWPEHGRITVNDTIKKVPGDRNADNSGPSTERYGRMANIRKTDQATV